MNTKALTLLWAMVTAFALATPSTAFAHCDSLDGPVVKAAERALASGDLAHVLIWVQPEDEAEISAAFAQALAVRPLSAQSRSLADRYFFETVVRIHRAGEGAAFTGLKPAGEIAAVVSAADRALSEQSVKPLADLLTADLMAGLHRHFEAAAAARRFQPADIAAGRSYVKAYVEYLHYVERVHEAMQAAAHGRHVEVPR